MRRRNRLPTSKSFRATLKGDHLEWQGDSPAIEGRAVAVRVTLLHDVPQQAQQGTRMAAALEQLADRHVFAELTDPAAWERDLREERELPDRS